MAALRPGPPRQKITIYGWSTRLEFVDRFSEVGPRGLERLRGIAAGAVVAWPPADTAVTLVEALRIVVLEATVHLLDVQRALDRQPDVPASALRETALFLAELAPPVAFIEAATGRCARSPLPVLR